MPPVAWPYIQKAPFNLNQFMICWKDSRPAVLVVTDLTPLLTRAGHIARHRLDVRTNRIIRERPGSDPHGCLWRPFTSACCAP